MNDATRRAYEECRQIARAHYENFPVASWLLPARMRRPIAAIYVFARRADDLADEGFEAYRSSANTPKKRVEPTSPGAASAAETARPTECPGHSNSAAAKVGTEPGTHSRQAIASLRERRRAALQAMRDRITALHRARDDTASDSNGVGGTTSDDDPLWIALGDTIKHHDLPLEPFLDLLSAFEQDLDRQRYASFGDVMNYCRRSANPIGRLLLHLHGSASPKNLAYSDAICSALQLLNFYQDLGQDLAENDRIYLPADEMTRFGVTESMLERRLDTLAIRQLLNHSIDRADRLLRAGAPLGHRLKGRFGLEIRAIVAGGARIAWRLKNRAHPFERPRLDTRDRLAVLRNAIFPPKRL